MIKNGHPYSNENGWIDDGLITNKPQEIQDIVLSWIRDNFLPRKTELTGSTRLTAISFIAISHLLAQKREFISA